jgi:hypothetical protein
MVVLKVSWCCIAYLEDTLLSIRVMVYFIFFTLWLVFLYHVIYPIGGVDGGSVLRGFAIGHIGAV